MMISVKNSYYLQIPQRSKPGISYGIACNFQDNGEFSFIVGEESDASSENINDKFVGFQIPEENMQNLKYVDQLI